MKRSLALFAVLLLILPLCSCAAKPAEQSFFAMNTVMSVRIWHDDGAAADAAAVQALVNTLERALSVTNPGSEIAQLNGTGSGTLSDDTLYLLEKTLALSARTGSALDPTLYPIVRLWGFTTDAFRVPSEEEIAAALKSIGTEHITQSGNTVTLADGTMLDFGAVAKGYAAQKSAEFLTRSGVEAAMLSFGGNIQTVGSKPDGTDWKIGIQDPFDAASNAAVLSLSGSGAVVTSGGYQRYFEENGETYCHIMDPKTGAPVQGDLASVTIVAPNGMLADGLSTALYVMGFDDACEFWRTSDDFEAILITNAGDIYITEGLDGRIDGAQYQVITR